MRTASLMFEVLQRTVTSLNSPFPHPGGAGFRRHSSIGGVLHYDRRVGRETVLGALVTLGYPAIAVIVGLESAGLPLPGEVTLLSASYLAAMGHFSLPLVVGAAALGAVVGDSLGYLIGRQGGRRFLEKYGKHGGITPKKLAKADEYFMRHGGKTVFFGRFIVLLRILAGPLAGASRMPYRRFLVANIAGALASATTMGTLDFFFGKALAAVLNSLGVWALVAVAAFLMLRVALKQALEHRLHKRRTGTPPRPTSVGKEAAPAVVVRRVR